MSKTLYISGGCFRSGLGLTPEEEGAHLIEIEDQPLPKAGSQGAIYRVVSIDGRRLSGKLVKWLANGLPPSLKDIVNALRVNIASYQPEERVSLNALPLFLFESSRDGEPFHGYLMRELGGCTFLDIVLQDINGYINLPLETRLDLCLQFVEGMNVLYGSSIIHTDLNGQNLMLDLKRRSLAIINVDGGAVGNTGGAPIALKFEPGWLAPEIDRQLVSSTRREAPVLDVGIDLWLIACGIHHLLFGLSPFFFAATQPDIDSYLKRYQWPTLKGLAGVELQNTGAFDYFERAYRDVPDLHSLFQQSFQTGYYDPAARPDPYQWMRVIRRALLPISSPDDATEAVTQVRRYLALALDEGTLTSSEKTFITNQGIRLGIPQAEVESIIDEEQRNWWDTVDQVVSHKRSGLRPAQTDSVASQVSFQRRCRGTGTQVVGRRPG